MYLRLGFQCTQHQYTGVHSRIWIFFLCFLIYFVFSNNHMYTCDGSVIVYCYWMNHNFFVSLGIFWKVANLIWSYYLLFANFYLFLRCCNVGRFSSLFLIYSQWLLSEFFWMFVCGVGVIRRVVTWFRTTLVVVVIFFFRFRGGLLRLSDCLTGFMWDHNKTLRQMDKQSI
jgi:hypothetical protein